MSDFLHIFEYKSGVSLTLDAGNGRVLSAGEKMNAVCPEAYMNGYNWDAFLRCYLEKNDPDILIGMGSDPEAETYEAHWPLSPENEARAKRLGEIIRSLLADEDALCRFVRENGGEIEWD